jgi:hypothetical protein
MITSPSEPLKHYFDNEAFLLKHPESHPILLGEWPMSELLTNEGASHLAFEMWETTKASIVFVFAFGGWRKSE